MVYGPRFQVALCPYVIASTHHGAKLQKHKIPRGFGHATHGNGHHQRTKNEHWLALEAIASRSPNCDNGCPSPCFSVLAYKTTDIAGTYFSFLMRAVSVMLFIFLIRVVISVFFFLIRHRVPLPLGWEAGAIASVFSFRKR